MSLRQTQKKIEETVVSTYRKIENGVVSGYQKIENGIVNGYKEVEDYQPSDEVASCRTKVGNSTGEAGAFSFVSKAVKSEIEAERGGEA